MHFCLKKKVREKRVRKIAKKRKKKRKDERYYSPTKSDSSLVNEESSLGN